MKGRRRMKGVPPQDKARNGEDLKIPSHLVLERQVRMPPSTLSHLFSSNIIEKT